MMGDLAEKLYRCCNSTSQRIRQFGPGLMRETPQRSRASTGAGKPTSSSSVREMMQEEQKRVGPLNAAVHDR
jgi:hypothetical protein